MAQVKITAQLAKKVLRVVDKGLSYGLGGVFNETKDEMVGSPGAMCVEAAVCYALGEEHGDRPSCVNDELAKFKIDLNDDLEWENDKARARGLRRLAIAQLGTKTGFSYKSFYKLYVAKLDEAVLAIEIPKFKTVGEFRDWCENNRFADSGDLPPSEAAECAVQALIKMKTPGSKFLYLAPYKKAKK